jgi:hypothetical protein
VKQQQYLSEIKAATYRNEGNRIMQQWPKGYMTSVFPTTVKIISYILSIVTVLCNLGASSNAATGAYPVITTQIQE